MDSVGQCCWIYLNEPRSSVCPQRLFCSGAFLTSKCLTNSVCHTSLSLLRQYPLRSTEVKDGFVRQYLGQRFKSPVVLRSLLSHCLRQRLLAHPLSYTSVLHLHSP